MVLTRLLVVLAVALAACDDDGAATPDLGAEEAIGRAFVAERGCATCHQQPNSTNELAGGVEVAAGVFGSNLTPDATGLGHWADIEIVRAMRYGVDNAQMALCPQMPRYDGSDPMYPFMTDVEANAIVAYLRALPPVANRVMESECPPIKPRPPVDMAVPSTPDDMTEADHD